MKKSSSNSSPAVTRTTSRNLERRFATGRSVLDYFDASRVVVTHGGRRSGSGRKAEGRLRKTVKLSPEAIRRVEAFARRRKLASFSAALEAAALAL